MDGNAFGKLVRAYREQRGWKQGELAERWGFTREYVSQIERGKRKLDKPEQVTRLADILGISEDQLAQVGKGMPPKKLSAQHPGESDDILLQALLEPAQTTVKLSWLIWQGNSMPTDLADNLTQLESRLNEALGLYRGQFHKQALRILAYLHEMLGKQAVERLSIQDATRHFQEMYDIAEELNDMDLLTLSTVHQAELFRRRGRFEAAFRRLGAAEARVRGASPWLEGFLWKIYARNFFVYGDEQNFLRAIDRASAIAEETVPTIDTITHHFDKVEVLQEKAQGYTMLWKPEKALEIYQQTDALRPFRPLRDQSSYHIVKAQAYCYSGELKMGIDHALTGLHMAEKLHSGRYVMRLQQMSERLSVTKIGKETPMRELRGEVSDTLSKLRPYL